MELRDLVEELDATGGVVGAADLHLVGADELLVVADLAVERLEEIRDDELVRRLATESLEGAERVDVRHVALEDRAVAVDRLFDLRHLRLAKRREAEHERDLRVVVGRERELRLEVLGELAPHLLAREERVESRERGGRRGVELEDALVRGDGVVGRPSCWS